MATKTKKINKASSVMDLGRKLLGVSVKHCFTLKQDSESEEVFKINANINFSECTIEMILQDAIKTIIIREQNRLRKRDASDLLKMSEATVKGECININPAEKGTRGTVGIDRALKQVLDNLDSGKFTKEQLDKLISGLEGK